MLKIREANPSGKQKAEKSNFRDFFLIFPDVAAAVDSSEEL